MKRSLILLVCGALVGCGGDGEPADPASARAEIDAVLPSLVNDTADSLDGADSTAGMQGLRASMTSMNESFQGLPFELPFADVGTTIVRKVAADEERPGEALARWLKEHVFVDSAYEGDGVYRLRGANLCPIEDGATVPDPDCVKAIDDAELRLRVTKSGEGGLDLVLLVGPARAEPITVELHKDAIDVALDLAEAKEALEHLAEVAGKELDLPATMKGRLAVNLTRRGPQHVELSFAVRETVEVSGSMDEGPYALKVAATDPTLRFALDVPGARHELTVDVGHVTLEAPWQAVSSESQATGQFLFELRALKLAAVLSQTLKVTGISLGDGPLAIKLDGTTLIGVELNDGGSLDLEVVPGARPRFLLSPSLQVVVTLATKKLAAAGDDVAAWTNDEIVTVKAGQEVQPYPGGVKAVRGAISIATQKTPASVTAAEGQCLTGSPLTAGEHPLIGLFSAVACP